MPSRDRYHTLREAGLCAQCGVVRSDSVRCPACAHDRRRGLKDARSGHICAMADDPDAHMARCVSLHLRPPCDIRRVSVFGRQPHDAYVDNKLARVLDRCGFAYAHIYVSASGPLYCHGGSIRMTRMS